MSSFEIGILVFISFSCVFAIINRICTCIEDCVRSRAFGKAVDLHKNVSELVEGKMNED